MLIMNSSAYIIIHLPVYLITIVVQPSLTLIRLLNYQLFLILAMYTYLCERQILYPLFSVEGVGVGG